MKIRVALSSCWILGEIDACIRRYDVRGPVERFHDVASDALDGLVTRQEVDDLVRRRLLEIVHYSKAEVGGELWQTDLCGGRWSVNMTEKMIRGLWPDRVKETAHVAR